MGVNVAGLFANLLLLSAALMEIFFSVKQNPHSREESRLEVCILSFLLCHCSNFRWLTPRVLLLLQNFLYSTKADDAPLKAIDFGLSDFVLPGRSHSWKPLLKS